MSRLAKEITLFRIFGAPVIVHWSVGLVLPLIWLAQQRVTDALATFLAYFVVIAVHEIGHAWAARRCGLAILALRIYPLHGLCQHERPFLKSQRIAIAWGGVAAQAVLAAVGIVISEVASLAGIPLPAFLDSVLMVWVVINLMILFLNLCPIPPLDGVVAWQAVPQMWKQWRKASPTPSIAARNRARTRPFKGGDNVVEFDRRRGTNRER